MVVVCGGCHLTVERIHLLVVLDALLPVFTYVVPGGGLDLVLLVQLGSRCSLAPLLVRGLSVWLYCVGLVDVVPALTNETLIWSSLRGWLAVRGNP